MINNRPANRNSFELSLFFTDYFASNHVEMPDDECLNWTYTVFNNCGHNIFRGAPINYNVLLDTLHELNLKTMRESVLKDIYSDLAIQRLAVEGLEEMAQQLIEFVANNQEIKVEVENE